MWGCPLRSLQAGAHTKMAITRSDEEDPLYLRANSSSIYKVTRELKKEQSGIFNCLCSIVEDSVFVQEVKALYPTVPLLANLRCGLWYAPRLDGTCYFKSTDGHNGNWYGWAGAMQGLQSQQSQHAAPPIMQDPPAHAALCRSFSVTRLNLEVARLAASEGGVVIVDATRKGKSFPVSSK